MPKPNASSNPVNSNQNLPIQSTQPTQPKYKKVYRAKPNNLKRKTQEKLNNLNKQTGGEIDLNLYKQKYLKYKLKYLTLLETK